LEAVPWVHRVSVRRRFPQDIEIEFTEQALGARWTEGAWVNTSGEVVRVPGPGLPMELPRLEGPEGTAAQVWSAFGEFRQALVGTALIVTSVRLTPRRHWELELKKTTGTPATVILVLDQEQPHTRLERFVRAYGETFATRAASIKKIDLRYTNGFAVEWRNTRVGNADVPGASIPNEG
jgi:cell division protein FtsQ